MNMAANPNKMAVTDNQHSTPVHGAESRDEHDTKPLTVKPFTNDVNFKKKSTFKITSVTKSSAGSADISNDTENDVEHDSNDDLDETVESHTEDASSEILDISKYTDGGEPVSPMEEETSDQSNTVATKDVSNKSDQANKEKTEQQGPHPTRFKVVKIETSEPFKRGRWTCRDTLDYPAPDKSDTKINENITSQTSSGGDENKIHAKTMVQVENRDNFNSENSIRQSQSVGQQQIPSSNLQSNVAQQMQSHQPPSNFHNGTGYIHPGQGNSSFIPQGPNSMQTSEIAQPTYVYTGPPPGQVPSLMQPTNNVQQFNKEQYIGNDNVIQNVEKIELDTVESKAMGANLQQDYSGADVQNAILTPQSVAEVVGIIPSPQEEESGSSTVAIDNKIEQAMDLVKSHLMYAVREEVEVLKEQIKELMEKNQQLEYENQILKSSASPETLAKLSSLPPSSSS